MKKIKVAGIQISIFPNDIKKNLEKIEYWLFKAIKETQAQLYIFPESVTTGFTPNMPLSDFYAFLPDINIILKPFSKICKEKKIMLVLPTYEKTKEKNKIFNSAFFINAEGKVCGAYRKTHLFPTERLAGGGWSTAGSNYPVFKTEFANIGIMICYDGDFPEVARILTINGAEIIARPSALLRTFEIWEMTNKARAYDNHIYVIGVNAVGPDAGNNYFFGHSMIVSPIAQKLAQARGTEDIIYAELSPDPIKNVSYGSNAPMLFDHLQDRNVKTYKNYLTKKYKSHFEPFKRIEY
ncbi:MAG TPA: carbon-nitrogen hydrolase family protein [bacterium]|nr:carbon-nitrogen hydrolase family protein [bacterium]HPQ19429.1 carbon-nitrogen hydrolase family protein [bacterium]